MCSGSQVTAALAARARGRISSARMNHSSTTRKISSCPAAPARRIAMPVRGLAHEEPRRAEPRGDLGRRLGDGTALQRPEAAAVAALLVGGREHGEAVAAAQLEVLLAAARRDVDDARPLVGRHRVPRDHAMRDAPLGGQIVEGGGVAEPDEVGAGEPLAHVGEAGPARARRRRHVVAPVAHLHALVGQLRMDGEGHVGGQASTAWSSTRGGSVPDGPRRGTRRPRTGASAPRGTPASRAARSRCRTAGTTA